MPEIELELTGQRPPSVTETATKPSPAPLQNHSRGGCTVDMPVKLPSAGPIISSRDTLFGMNCHERQPTTGPLGYPESATAGVYDGSSGYFQHSS